MVSVSKDSTTDQSDVHGRKNRGHAPDMEHLSTELDDTHYNVPKKEAITIHTFEKQN